MNKRHLLSLLQTDYTTVKVVFEPHSSSKTYTFKVPLSMNVAVGDDLVVDSPTNGLVIVRVVEVHAKPEIDLNANFKYKWAVCKVDLEQYNQRLLQEKEFDLLMADIEREKQRESLIKDMRDHLPEGSNARAMFESATSKFGVDQKVLNHG